MSQIVLLLNADYTVLNAVSMRRAVVLYIKGKVNILKHDEINGYIHPVLEIYKPIVVGLKQYVYIPFRPKYPTRRKILQRDSYRCQYCDRKLNDRTATIDHVVPKSNVGFPGNTWKNLVAACKRCNNKKGDKALHNAGMNLARKPFQPDEWEHIVTRKDEWKEFLTNKN